MVSLGNRSGKVKVGKRKGNSIMAKKKKTFSSQTDVEVIRKKNIEEGKGIASKVDRKKPIAIGDEKKRQRSASSVSSTGSPVRKKRKRVSFADQLERTKLIDQSLNKIEGIPSDASPGKSILSKKLKEVKKKKKAAEDMSRDAGRRDSLTGEKVIENIESGEMNVSMEATPAQEMHENKKGKENRQREKRGTGVDKAKKFNAKKIQVTRKVKEKLMAMTRKERREFIKELQRKRKPNFELALQCKRLWEKIRSSKCTEEDRERYVHELYGLVKGKAKELIYAHDTCRVIECLTSLPKGNIRSLLFEELCPEIVRMTKSKYARFFVTKMLRHGCVVFICRVLL
ncbi:unnamed protein product [Toxocara canis]|uniref:PUM-HD domain-containing protein n=1 Tax=Toxocara canis TaxID=6265 RepID=A0A183VB13_TOXCA|nr:unnamed protein product [Toxocara canis]